MSPLVRLTAGAIFAVLALGGPARADMRTMPAKQLVLNEAMAGDTTIEVDSTLSGQVRVSMDEGLDCLVMVESETMVIDASRCGDHDLRVAVPQGLPIVLNASGGGDIRIGDVDGPLTLSLSGHGDVSAGRTAQLLINLNGGSDVSVGAVSGSTVLNLSGSGDLKLKSLDGPLVLKKNGSGDVAIGSINAPGVEVEDSGSGDVILGAGTIGSLRVNLNGSSDFATAATIRDADLNAHGGGDMRVGKVTGTIRRNASGGSEIRIGTSDTVSGIIADVASDISKSKDPRTSVPSGTFSMIGHFLTIGVVGFLIYFIYRIIRRSGGVAGLTRRRSQAQAPSAPTHAGVIAVCEALVRVEQRLGRVEAYVTSREFDLQQKFREMGRS